MSRSGTSTYEEWWKLGTMPCSSVSYFLFSEAQAWIAELRFENRILNRSLISTFAAKVRVPESFQVVTRFSSLYVLLRLISRPTSLPQLLIRHTSLLASIHVRSLEPAVG